MYLLEQAVPKPTTKPLVFNLDVGTNTWAPHRDLRLWAGSDTINTSVGQFVAAVLYSGGDEGVDDFLQVMGVEARV